MRGVGKVPIVPPSAALANAIYCATGTRLYELPMNPEQIFWATRGNGTNGSQGTNGSGGA